MGGNTDSDRDGVYVRPLVRGAIPIGATPRDAVISRDADIPDKALCFNWLWRFECHMVGDQPFGIVELVVEFPLLMHMTESCRVWRRHPMTGGAG